MAARWQGRVHVLSFLGGGLGRGKPEKSVLLHQMTLLGLGQMPIIGRKTIERKVVDLIRRWIAEMKPQQK